MNKKTYHPKRNTSPKLEHRSGMFRACEQEIFRALASGQTSLALDLADRLPSDKQFVPDIARIRCIIALEGGEISEAEKYADEYERLRPDGNSHLYKARVLFAKGGGPELFPILHKALTEPISTDNIVRCHNLLGQLYRRRGDAMNSIKACYNAFQASEQMPLYIRIHQYSNYLFNSHYLPYNPSELAEKHFHFQDVVSEGDNGIRPLPIRRRENIRAGLPPERAKKIRIGYISPDLHEHVVLYFSRLMFTCANREKFELYAYSNGFEDSYSQELKQFVDGWQNISNLTLQEAARVIAADNLDILVDLSGHTNNGVLGILAYKPAPIIISGIGYFSTIGLDAVDYFISDIYLSGAPEPGIYEHPLFKEKLLVLPHTHWSYSHLHPRRASSLTAPAKKNGYVTFGSFNVMAKVNDEVMTTWKKILDQVPGSRLLLKGAALDRPADKEYISEKLKNAGFDLSRIELRPSSVDYLDDYADMDIALDTFPYGGGATTMDALYMSVPVISLIGETHHARFGYSILQNIGLGELACATVDEYIDRACLIASDLDTINALHQSVRTMLENSILMDGSRYMAELEPFYEAIYEDYRLAEEA